MNPFLQPSLASFAAASSLTMDENQPMAPQSLSMTQVFACLDQKVGEADGSINEKE